MPEQKVVLDPDPARARAKARAALALYFRLPNYTRNLARLGFGPDDLADGGSDRVVDALVAWGDVETVLRRAGEHLAAGADQVCLQVINDTYAQQTLPWPEWRALGAALPAVGSATG